METVVYIAGFTLLALLLIAQYRRGMKWARVVLPKVRQVSLLTASERIQTIYEARRETRHMWNESLTTFVFLYLPNVGVLAHFRAPLGWAIAFVVLLALQAFFIWISGNHDTLVKLATDQMSPEERRSLWEYTRKRQGLS